MDYEKEYKEALERAKAGKPMDEVFLELKESEDERIRKEIIHYILYGTKETVGKDTKNTWIAYLEKQKEQKPLSTEETELNSIAFLEQMGYTCIPPKEQNPAEWSEEDSRILYNVIAYVGYAAGQRGVRDDEFKEANSWLKSLRPQPHWKPCEEQMKGIECAIKTLKYQLNCGDKRLDSLYNDLKKL